jgi:hypothetical protein
MRTAAGRFAGLRLKAPEKDKRKRKKPPVRQKQRTGGFL